jgi:hypothetical protein
VIDHTSYAEHVERAERAEREASIPIVITEMKDLKEERRLETPFASVTETAEETPPPLPKKKWHWSIFSFFAIVCVGLFAMNKFAVKRVAPATSTAAAPPPAAEAVPTYTPAEGDVPPGHGVLEVAAPPDAVVVVDGKERARGHAKLPITSGAHDVRVRTSSDERGCGVDVRASRVVHVKF